jgi:hypothetical protein
MGSNQRKIQLTPRGCRRPAAAAVRWWLSRQAKTGKLADQGIDLAPLPGELAGAITNALASSV